uniref:Membrane spanning 4-domains A13 n=1 Tax=Rhinolophus ferrumequinum TaxID=59479 RepID=A0A671DVB2_RHIFE
MIGIFHVLMWYLLLILYIGQIKGKFGTYEPLTYKTGCVLWGIVFVISGVILIRVTRFPTQRLKLGREISRILLFSYPLELGIACMYSIFTFIDLNRGNEETFRTVTEEAESAL